jgi:hypothetical protein
MEFKIGDTVEVKDTTTWKPFIPVGTKGKVLELKCFTCMVEFPELESPRYVKYENLELVKTIEPESVKPFKVGDRVSVGNWFGEVTHIHPQYAFPIEVTFETGDFEFFTSKGLIDPKQPEGSMCLVHAEPKQEPKVIEQWVNVYPDYIGINFDSEAEANECYNAKTRIGCIKLVGSFNYPK